MTLTQKDKKYILSVDTKKGKRWNMRKTKIFKSGNSQAVRIPSDFHLEGDEVEIIKRNREIILREIPKNLGEAFILFTKFSDDFFAEGRIDTPSQKKDLF